jgi:hypothetical protein
MGLSTFDEIMVAFKEVHQDILEFVNDLSEEEMTWQPHASANSIAFYLWHIARWADYLPASLPNTTSQLRELLGSRQQIWHQEQLAQQWQLDPKLLGEEESGMDMDPTAAAQLKLPAKETLIRYAGRTFAVLEEVVALVDTKQFQAKRQQEWATDTLGHYILSHLRHESEHLGMIRYIHGLYQMRAVTPNETI